MRISDWSSDVCSSDLSPGILGIFLFGLFWKKTTTRAALTVAIVLLPLSIVVDKLLFPAMPFMNQMGLCFLVLSALTIGISLAKPEDNTGKIIEFHCGFFRTDRDRKSTRLHSSH